MQVFQPGSVIQRFEVLHERVWMHSAVTVVSDDGEILAVRLDPGSEFTFPDHPFGPHPWSARAAWGETVVLRRREWKDVPDLHWQRDEGRIDQETVSAVLAAAAEVTDLLDSDTRWWDSWDGWAP